MRDELDSLEQDLKGWRPRRPPATLRTAVAGRLAESPLRSWAPPRGASVFSWRTGLAPLACGAAAGLALAAFGLGYWWAGRTGRPDQTADRSASVAAQVGPPVARVSREPCAPEASGPIPAPMVVADLDDEFRPVAVARVLTGAQEEGIMVREGAPPLRWVRYRYLEHGQWHNPARDARLQVTTPRERVMLVAAGAD